MGIIQRISLLSQNLQGITLDKEDGRQFTSARTVTTNEDRACLDEAIRLETKMSNALMYTVAYIHPSIETLYKYGDRHDLHNDISRPNIYNWELCKN